MAEWNNELPVKKHETHPVGSPPFPEVNVTNYSPISGKGHSSN